LLVRDDGNTVTGSASAIDFIGGSVTESGDEVTVDLSGIGSSYTDEQARDAIAAMLQAGTGISLSYDDAADTLTIDGTAQYTDSDAVAAINADTDHGSTAQHDYFSGDHTDLTGLSPDDHHSRYTDGEAVAAVESVSGSVDISISGDADTLDGYEGAELAALAEDEAITGVWQHGTNGQLLTLGDSTFDDKYAVIRSLISGGAIGHVTDGGDGRILLQGGENKSIAFRADQADGAFGGTTPHVLIDTTGNTGFGGKTDPRHKVDVDGRTRSTEVEATDTLILPVKS
jgi:hypothetical protein